MRPSASSGRSGSVRIAACFLLILLPVFTVMAPAVLVRAQTPGLVFSTPMNISNDSKSAQDPNVQNVGSHVYVVWTERSNGIRFRESPDGGVTWVPPLNMPALRVSNAGGTAQYPLMSENGTNVYVVWAQTIGTTGLQIMEATSANNGLSFTPPVQLTSGSPAGGFIGPAIASWGNNVYVGYDNNTNGQAAFVTCSNQSGAPGTWTHPFMFGSFHEAQVAAWGGKYVYAVSDRGFATSTDNCATWKNVVLSVPKVPSEPWIAAYSNNSYMAGETKGSASNVEYTTSNNNGTTWSNAANFTISNAWAPMVGAHGNSSWIALQTHPGSSSSEVWVFTTNNGGGKWTGPALLSGIPAKGSDTSFPFTVATSDGQNVFVAWSQQIISGYWVMRIAYSSDGGTTWTSTPSSPASSTVSQNTTGEAGNNNDVATGAISAFGTHCYVVWQYVNGASNQIYFARS
ncbi:MAG: sialidase family protein [Nitrososphaerales archaeon]